MQSFEKTKFALAEAATLEYEDHGKPLILSSDASDTHVGAVFEQEKKRRKNNLFFIFFKMLAKT